MALHTLENGTLGWICPHCQRDNSAHHSHEGVQHFREDSIALPQCSCGSQTFLNVHPDMRGIAPGSESVMSRHLEVSRMLKAAGKGPGTPAVSAQPAPAVEAPEPEPVEETPAEPPAEVLSEDTAQRAAVLQSRRMHVQVDPDGVMHWTCRQCGNDWVYSMRNSNVAWDGPDTIKLPTCACGNAPRLAAKEYSELAKRLREIGKAP